MQKSLACLCFARMFLLEVAVYKKKKKNSAEREGGGTGLYWRLITPHEQTHPYPGGSG